MIDPWAYRNINGTWRHPADKHIPRPLTPPYGSPKLPELTWQDWPAVLLVLGLLALAGALRLIRGAVADVS